MYIIYKFRKYFKMQYNNNNNDSLYGVHTGVMTGQNERVDELNQRMQTRYFPDITLAPNFDPRPVQTKQTLFPIMNIRKDSTYPILPSINHNVENNFNPGTRKGPSNGFLSNIDTETKLRNQTAVLQHGANQNVYVPSSSSDLYKVHVVSSPSEQPFPGLFVKEQLITNIPSSLQQGDIGRNRFSNHTRTQLRNM